MDERRKIFRSDLLHRAIVVYLYLKDRADKEGKCYPAIGTIAREVKMSESTVKRAISDLWYRSLGGLCREGNRLTVRQRKRNPEKQILVF